MSAETEYPSMISGWFERQGRARLVISGPDRAKFLNNLTTNDVKRLSVGHGQESFVTNPQGKTLAYVTLLATDDAIFLRTESASLEGLAPHLAKYGIFDDVAIDDESASTFEIHLFGSRTKEILEAEGLSVPESGSLRHNSSGFSGASLHVVEETITPMPGYTLIGPISVAESIRSALAARELAPIESSVVEALRIEAGVPLSGRDVAPSNLPQEVGRDSRTINFVKGCYLGQETVARLDALGHVNRILKGLTVEGSATVPAAGTPLVLDGKTVGTISSGAFSARWGCPIALGYLRIAQATAGTRLGLSIDGVGEVSAVVRDLPMGSGPQPR